MSGEAPFNSDENASSSVGRVTIERLISPEVESLAPELVADDRFPRPPLPDPTYQSTLDDALLQKTMDSGVSLIGITGAEERLRAQVILRQLQNELNQGQAWLWVELGGIPSSLHIFESLFGLLHIPVPYGLTQLLRRVDEEDSTDCSLSEEALEEYELSREILTNALLIRQAKGLALHLHYSVDPDDPELRLLMKQLSYLSERVRVLVSATTFPKDFTPLVLKSQKKRALPTLSGYATQSQNDTRSWARDELLMTLTQATTPIRDEDLLDLVPSPRPQDDWSAIEIRNVLLTDDLLKQLETGAYLLTTQGRTQAYILQKQSAPDANEERELRFARSFARYGTSDFILQLDGEEGGHLINRYIEAKGNLEAALDTAVAYAWPEAAYLALGITALAERHGPALMAQRALVLAHRVPLSDALKLQLEIKLTMLQESDQLATILEGYRQRADSLNHHELYAEVSYLLAKLLQRIGDNVTAYRLMRDLRDRFDQVISESLMIQILNTLGFTCFILQRDEEAYRSLTQAVERARRTGSLRLQAKALTSLGVFHSRRGNHEEARRSHQSAINIHQHLKSYIELCPSLCNLADAYRVEGKHEEALRLFERTLKVSIAYGNHSILALLWGNIGEEQLAVGMVEEAEASLKRGIQLLKERGNMSVAGIFLGVLGYLYGVYHEFSRATEAHEAFSEGDELLNGVFGLETERAKLWLKWGLARVKWRQHEEAQRAYEFALQLTMNHIDVELKVWLDRLQQLAVQHGFSLPQVFKD